MQPVGPHVGQVDGGGKGAEGVVGANVGGRLLAPDVLFAGLQGEDETAPALAVEGLSDQAGGEAADELGTAGHEADVGTAEAGREAELLAFADGDVGPVLARRGGGGEGDG